MFGGGAVQAGIAFVSNLILIAFLSPSAFGNFAIAQANLGLVHSLLNYRLGDLIVRTKAEEIDDDFIRLVSSYAAAQVVSAGFVSLAVLWATVGVNIPILLLWAGTLLSIPVGIALQLFEKRFDYRTISRIETGSHGASHVLAAAMAAAGAGAIVLYLRNAARLAVMAMCLMLIGAMRLAWPRTLTLAEGKLLIKRVRDMWLDGVLEQGIERITVLLVASAGGAAGAGYFYQARRLAGSFGQLVDPVTSRMSFNYFSNRVTETKRLAAVTSSILLLLAMMIVFVAALLASAELLVTTMFGKQWLPVVDVLFALTPFIICISLVSILRAHYFATYATYRFIALVRLPIALIAIGGGWVLVLADAASAVKIAALVSAGYLCASATGVFGIFGKHRQEAQA